MLFSRCTAVFKTASYINKAKSSAINLQSVRLGSGLSYRSAPPLTTYSKVLSEIGMGIFWWWILWNFWHDYKIIFYGELPAPVPEHWTDEELGIPPEDD